MKHRILITGAMALAMSTAFAADPAASDFERFQVAQAATMQSNTGSQAGTKTQAAGGKEADASKADRKFAQQAAEANAIEIQTSEMALEKATDPQVKEYAKRMIDQHSKANEELLAVINQTIPEKWRPMKELPPQRKKEMESLQKLSGAQFDKKYMDTMAKSHERAVKLYEKQVKDGKNEQLKAYAEKTLPAIKEHTKMVKGMAQQGGTSSGSSGK